MQSRCLNSDHLEYLPVRLQTHNISGNKAPTITVGKGKSRNCCCSAPSQPNTHRHYARRRDEPNHQQPSFLGVSIWQSESCLVQYATLASLVQWWIGDGGISATKS